jgi:hypothetical protein
MSLISSLGHFPLQKIQASSSPDEEKLLVVDFEEGKAFLILVQQ